MKVIITGAAGFIGYHLSKKLLKKKIKVFGIDSLNNYYSNRLKKDRLKELKRFKNFSFYKVDLNNYTKSLKIFKTILPNTIFHLASQPGIIYSYKNRQTYKNNNINVTKNLIDISNKIKINKFYFTSSSSVYGNKRKYPIKESFRLTPMNYYAETKKICEKLLIKKLKSDIDLKIFRPFTVYGPYSRPDMLFIKYLESYKSKKPFILFNNGDYIRDFTYIEDVVKILVKALKIEKINKNIINICSSEPVSIKKIVYLINKFYKKKKLINFQNKRKGEMVKTFGDNNYATKIIGKNKFINIETGIVNTIKWYKNYKNKKNLKFNKF